MTTYTTKQTNAASSRPISTRDHMINSSLDSTIHKIDDQTMLRAKLAAEKQCQKCHAGKGGPMDPSGRYYTGRV